MTRSSSPNTTSASKERTAVLEATREREDVPSVPPSPPRKRPVRRLLILAALGVGTIAASIFGYRWWQYASTHQETDDAYVSSNLHPVGTRVDGTVTDVLVDDNQLVQKGQLLVKLDPHDYEVKVQQAQAALAAARRQADVAQANIAVVTQNAQGQTTQAQGDVSNADATIATTQAAVAEAQAGIPQAEAAVAEARAGVPAAQAQLAQAKADRQKTQVDYNRYASLYQAGAIPRRQLDSAKAAYKVALGQQQAAEEGVRQAQAKLAQAQQGVSSAQAKLAQAQQGVSAAQAKLTSSQGGVQQAKATGLQTKVNRNQYEAARAAIAQAAANLRDAQLQLSYTNILAPSSGRVGRKSVQVGQRLQPGQPLMAIVDNQNWVDANFKETQLEQMHPGEAVEIKLDSFPHHPFMGRVDSVAPASGAKFALLPPDNATGNFTKIVQRIPVKVVFDPRSIRGYESRIAPGMSAVVSVET